jgi:hypothetical protein
MRKIRIIPSRFARSREKKAIKLTDFGCDGRTPCAIISRRTGSTTAVIKLCWLKRRADERHASDALTTDEKNRLIALSRAILWISQVIRVAFGQYELAAVQGPDVPAQGTSWDKQDAGGSGLMTWILHTHWFESHGYLFLASRVYALATFIVLFGALIFSIGISVWMHAWNYPSPKRDETRELVGPRV